MGSFGNFIMKIIGGMIVLSELLLMLQPDHSAAVPKFGEWDESDPTSADGFTHVFNKVREEKMNGTGNVSAAAFRKPYYKDQKQHENKTSEVCMSILLMDSIALPFLQLTGC